MLLIHVGLKQSKFANFFVKSNDYKFLSRKNNFTNYFFRVHQHSTGLDILRVVKVSQSQARQRTGRAGRESEGNCYRMLTRNVRKVTFSIIEKYTFFMKFYFSGVC